MAHIRHKWSKAKGGHTCSVCGLFKFRYSEKLLMAITNSSPYNHYKYIQHTGYLLPNNGDMITELPSCTKA